MIAPLTDDISLSNAVGLEMMSARVERRAEHSGFGHLAAIAATDTGLIDRRYGIVTQQVRRLLQRKRWASRQADAGMIAGADILIDAELLADDALSRLDCLVDQRSDATLLVQHAL